MRTSEELRRTDTSNELATFHRDAVDEDSLGAAYREQSAIVIEAFLWVLLRGEPSGQGEEPLTISELDRQVNF
jgi:hypothetical protein